jgi:hypothetical protein
LRIRPRRWRRSLAAGRCSRAPRTPQSCHPAGPAPGAGSLADGQTRCAAAANCGTDRRTEGQARPMAESQAGTDRQTNAMDRWTTESQNDRQAGGEAGGMDGHMDCLRKSPGSPSSPASWWARMASCRPPAAQPPAAPRPAAPRATQKQRATTSTQEPDWVRPQRGSNRHTQTKPPGLAGAFSWKGPGPAATRRGVCQRRADKARGRPTHHTWRELQQSWDL